jgi:hypothetical protein
MQPTFSTHTRLMGATRPTHKRPMGATRCRVVLLAAAVLVSVCGLAPAGTLPPQALVIVDGGLPAVREARRAIEAAGGIVQGVVPPSVLLVRLPPAVEPHLTGRFNIRSIDRGTVPLPPAEQRARAVHVPREERLALLAWNQRLRAKSPAVQRRPLPKELLGRDLLYHPAGAPGDGAATSPAPASTPRTDASNSRYLVGDCVVTIFLTESTGALEPSTEDWTEAEEAQVTAEIQEGLSWLADAVNAAANANVTFIYEWHYAEPTRYEPISTRATVPSGNAAAFEVCQRYGYPGSLSGGQAFNSAQRAKYGADMAFMIFVADSSRDSDGYFADGYIAYAYQGGPWLVQNYRNDGWGISRMNQVTAHETCHVFGAADEYAASGATATQRYGYLQALNGNCETGGAGRPCLMKDNALTLCRWTLGHLGLQVPDGDTDGMPDALQYDPGGTLRRDQLRALSCLLIDQPVLPIVGNGNGRAEAGETVALRLGIVNDAFVTMRHVVGTLSTSSPNVAVVQSTASFGDVADAGGTAVTQAPFVVAIAPQAPNGTATFTVDLATEQNWHFSFTVDVPIFAAAPAPADRTPPAVPAGLAVAAVADRAVHLAWKPNTDTDLDHYNLYRSTRAGSGYTLIAHSTETKVVDRSVANGRTYYYRLTACDWAGNESARTTAVAATPGNAAPTVTILAPADGLNVGPDEEVDFSAAAADLEDGDLGEELVWFSSLQGEIGTGPALSCVLQPGTHRITAAVTDRVGRVAHDSVTVVVDEAQTAPAVLITAPADGSTVFAGDVLLLIATASDPQDGDLADDIRWSSDRDGDLGVGASLFCQLSPARHVITAAATNSAGETRTAAVTVVVVLAPLAAPADVEAAIGQMAVKLRWTDTNRGQANYRIERATAARPNRWRVVATVPAGAQEHKDWGLASDTYLYRVRAVRPQRLGPVSEPLLVRVGRLARLNAGPIPRGAKNADVISTPLRR